MIWHQTARYNKEKYELKKTVRLGDNLSPKVFSALLKDVCRRLGWKNREIKVNGMYISTLRFANDILFSENSVVIDLMINEFDQENEKVGMKISYVFIIVI